MFCTVFEHVFARRFDFPAPLLTVCRTFHSRQLSEQAVVTERCQLVSTRLPPGTRLDFRGEWGLAFPLLVDFDTFLYHVALSRFRQRQKMVLPRFELPPAGWWHSVTLRNLSQILRYSRTGHLLIGRNKKAFRNSTQHEENKKSCSRLDLLFKNGKLLQ